MELPTLPQALKKRKKDLENTTPIQMKWKKPLARSVVLEPVDSKYFILCEKVCVV